MTTPPVPSSNSAGMGRIDTRDIPGPRSLELHIELFRKRAPFSDVITDESGELLRCSRPHFCTERSEAFLRLRQGEHLIERTIEFADDIAG